MPKVEKCLYEVRVPSWRAGFKRREKQTDARAPPLFLVCRPPFPSSPPHTQLTQVLGVAKDAPQVMIGGLGRVLAVEGGKSLESVPPSIPLSPTQADVRKAYLRLAVRLHPDKNPGDEVRGECV